MVARRLRASRATNGIEAHPSGATSATYPVNLVYDLNEMKQRNAHDRREA